MTKLAHELRERIQIKTPIQTPNTTSGGFDRGYTTVTTVWAGCRLIKKSMYRRGVQTREDDTHEFKVRRSSLSAIGQSFSNGFSSGFDAISDISILKTNYFVFMQRGSTVKGRLFRIKSIEDVEERREYLRFNTEEIEESGSGYSA